MLAQQVVFSRMNIVPGGDLYNLDQWDGYRSARDRVLGALADHHPGDNIVLTGDIHASGVADLKADAFDDDSAVIGAEFVGTSVSSGGNSLLGAALPFIMTANPHIKWADTSKRGWVHHIVSEDEWRADYRHVDDATVPDSPVSTATSWSLPRGGAIEQV